MLCVTDAVVWCSCRGEKGARSEGPRGPGGAQRGACAEVHHPTHPGGVHASVAHCRKHYLTAFEQRCHTTAQARELLDTESALDNISVVRPHSVHALLSCLDELSLQLGRVSWHSGCCVITSLLKYFSTAQHATACCCCQAPAALGLDRVRTLSHTLSSTSAGRAPRQA